MNTNKKINDDFCNYRGSVKIRYPKFIKNLLVCVEDMKFYKHHGFDIGAIAACIFVNIKKRKILYGASTITQQLAKNLFLSNERTYKRKIKEILLSRKIEKRYSKDEILDLYLNNVKFIQDVRGMDKASIYYYNKKIDQIGFFESLCLISLLPAPEDFNPKINPNLNKEARKKSIETLEFNKAIDKKDLKKLEALGFWENDMDLDKKYKDRFQNLFNEKN